jgi:hypothetical protein
MQLLIQKKKKGKLVFKRKYCTFQHFKSDKFRWKLQAYLCALSAKGSKFLLSLYTWPFVGKANPKNDSEEFCFSINPNSKANCFKQSRNIKRYLGSLIMVKSLTLNCRLTKYRSQNNRLSVRTSISQRSQRCSLINQRGRRISLSPDVFSYVSLPTLYTDADRRYLSFDQHSHAHTFSFSVSLLPCLTFFHL